MKGHATKGKQGAPIPVKQERTRSERGIVVETETGTKIYDDSKKSRIQSRCGELGERKVEGEATRLAECGRKPEGFWWTKGARRKASE